MSENRVQGTLIFWDWFSKRELEYYSLHTFDKAKQEELLDEFELNLNRYCDKLFFEISGNTDGRHKLVITAEGNVSLFDKVEILVGSAPNLNHWEVIAFKQPSDENFEINYQGLTIDTERLYYYPLENKNSLQVGIRLFFDSYSAERRESYLKAGWLILESYLGEKATALDVGYLDVRGPLAYPEEKDSVYDGNLFHLNQLAEFVASKRVKLN